MMLKKLQSGADYIEKLTAFPAGPVGGASKTSTPLTPSCSTDWSGANLIPKMGLVTFPNLTS